MPAPPLRNTLESGLTSGTAITVGNSGGDAGNAFSTVTGTCTYSTAFPMEGSLVAFCEHTAANQQSFVNWTGLGSITTSVWFRMYAAITGVTATKTWHPISNLTSTSAVCVHTEFNSVPVLRLRNPAGTTLATGSVTIPTNQRMRLEGRVLPSTTVGEAELKVWFTSPDSTGKPDDAISATAAVLGANLDRVDWGMPEFGGGMLFDIYIDDLALSTTGPLGPSPRGLDPDPSMKFLYIRQDK